MGGLIGGVVSGIGQVAAAKQQSKAAAAATKAAMTGYNYLTTGAGGANEQKYIDAGTKALGGVQSTQDAEAQLLGTAPISDQTKSGFNNYLNSTGYQFQLQQGQNAIGSDSSAKGLLNSGGTAKALTQYGQNLASTTFNNYLGQLGALNGQQQTTATNGQNALGQVASAGSTAGGAAANTLIAGGNAAAGGTVAAFNTAGNAIGSALGSIGGLGGVFGSSGSNDGGGQYRPGGVGLY